MYRTLIITGRNSSEWRQFQSHLELAEIIEEFPPDSTFLVHENGKLILEYAPGIINDNSKLGWYSPEDVNKATPQNFETTFNIRDFPWEIWINVAPKDPFLKYRFENIWDMSEFVEKNNIKMFSLFYINNLLDLYYTKNWNSHWKF